MLTIYRKKGGNIAQVPVENFKLNKTLTWIDAYAPTEEELDLLTKNFSIPLQEFKDALSHKENPRVEYGDNYVEILFKALRKKSDIEPHLCGIFMVANTVLFVHKHSLGGLPEEEKMVTKLLSRDSNHLLFRLLDFLIEHYDTTLDQIEDHIDDLEEIVLSKQEVDILPKTYTYKKRLIYLRKALKNNADVIKAIRQDHFKKIKPSSHFDDLYYDINRLMDLEETNRDRLSEILTLNLTSSSVQLNEVMKGLTIVASIIAFPMLISGIYGMNFVHMPETQWQYGYYIALSFMVLSVGLTLFYLKYKKYV